MYVDKQKGSVLAWGGRGTNITLHLCACLTCVLHLRMSFRSTPKLGLRPNTLDSVCNPRQSWTCLVKKFEFVERERRIRIRKEHWPEQLYYCQRFTLHFIPPLSLMQLKKSRSEGRRGGIYRSSVLCYNLNETGNQLNCLAGTRMS